MEAASQQPGQPWHSRVVGRLCPPHDGDAPAKWPQPRGRLPHLATALLPPGQPAELPGVPTASPHAALSRGGKSTARSPSQVDLLFAFFFFSFTESRHLWQNAPLFEVCCICISCSSCGRIAAAYICVSTQRYKK